MWLAAAVLAVENLPAQQPGRGVIVVQDQAGADVALYEGSHALLIGESDYSAGWPDLESIPRELAVVEAALQQQGFAVETYLDQGSAALEARVKAFIDRHGYSAGNRLLFFFSGHGHTRRTERYGDRGYFVPVDAPDPSRDERGFLSKAISMDQILTWSRDIEAKHALFLFDSCFSGSVFKVRALPGAPPHITHATGLPVVQFITAGSANETVPAQSVFTPAFVDALQFSKGDLNGDGYVTGMELGLHLQSIVPQHVRQSPQFGKHPDYRRARGDFVFVVGGARPPPPADLPMDTARAASIGKDAYDRGSYEEALPFLRTACDGLHADSCIALSVMHALGRGTPVDPAKAAALNGRACEAGSAAGCSNLGAMYEYGSGVPRDPDRAAELYRQACESGFWGGCSNLGAMYEKGDGIRQDLRAAVEIYRTACDAADSFGCKYLGALYRDGRGLRRDDGEAVRLFDRSCQLGDAEACSHLARMYAEGRGVAADVGRALALYRRACDAGFPPACDSLRELQ